MSSSRGSRRLVHHPDKDVEHDPFLPRMHCENCGRSTPVPPGLANHGINCIHCGKNPHKYSAIWACVMIVYLVLMLLFVFVSGDTIDEEDGDKMVVVWAGGFVLMFFTAVLMINLKVKLRMRRAIRQARARQRKAEQ